jgi:GNAT superfamily N-acetyltransferase
LYYVSIQHQYKVIKQDHMTRIGNISSFLLPYLIIKIRKVKMMSEIQIIVSDSVKNEYKELLHSGLSDYNKFIKGNDESQELTVLLKDVNGQIIGGVNGEILWDYFNINMLWLNEFHRKQGFGSLIINSLFKIIKEKGINNIQVTTNYENIKSFYLSIGFNIIGILNDRPKGFHTYYLYLDIHDFFFTSIDCPLAIDTNPATEDIDIFKTMYKHASNIIFGDQPIKEIYAIALLDQQMIGGISGSISWDWLSVNIYWVSESFRKQKIGTRLLQALEEYCFADGILHIYIGTTDHDAKLFYEKNGYQVFNINKDYPKGYNNYELVKTV